MYSGREAGSFEVGPPAFSCPGGSESIRQSVVKLKALVAVGCAGSVMAGLWSAIPARAEVYTAACAITATLDFGTSVVTTTPSIGVAYTLGTDAPGSCTGETSSTITFSGGGTAVAASCGQMILDAGHLAFTFDVGPSSSFEGSGDAAAQTWVFPGVDQASFDATAVVYAKPPQVPWLSDQMTACEQTGLSKFTFSGVIYYQYNNLA